MRSNQVDSAPALLVSGESFVPREWFVSGEMLASRKDEEAASAASSSRCRIAASRAASARSSAEASVASPTSRPSMRMRSWIRLTPLALGMREPAKDVANGLDPAAHARVLVAPLPVHERVQAFENALELVRGSIAILAFVGHGSPRSRVASERDRVATILGSRR
jgi:hypothetical protein